jgi:hypothetical protein
VWETISQEISQRVRQAHTLYSWSSFFLQFNRTSFCLPTFRSIRAHADLANQTHQYWSSVCQQFLRFGYSETGSFPASRKCNDTVPVIIHPPTRHICSHTSYTYRLLGPPACISLRFLHLHTKHLKDLYMYIYTSLIHQNYLFIHYIY